MAESAALSRRAASRRPRLRPGRLDLYLIGGVAGPFLLILLAAGAAMMLERALRLIHELAASGADIGYFFPLLARLVPYYFGLAIPAAFMVALILLVARLDERLELEAMLASGVSLARIAAPLVALGLVIGGAALAAGGWLEPLGRYSFRTVRAEALNAGRIGGLSPRAVYHPADSLAVTFDGREADGRVRGIFVWQRLADGETLVLTGESGRIGFLARERQFGIDLGAGRYLAEPAAGKGSPYLVGFDALAFRESLRLADARWARGWDQRELTLSELAAERRGGTRDIEPRLLAAEFYSRIARSATIPLLPLLVLPLVFAPKKRRRTVGILLCGAFLASAHHGMNFAKRLALAGAADPAAAILGAALLVAALVLLLFLSARHLPSRGPLHALLSRLGGATGRLAPRERALPGVRGGTVLAYLGWQLGKWSLIALVGIVALLQMVDLLDRGEDFVARGMTLPDIGRYALLRLPPMVQQAIPIAALAGAMAAFAGLGRSHEMTALRAAGVSQWRILALALPVPVAFAAASFAVAEFAAPASQPRFAAWWTATEPPGEAPAARWFRIGGEIVRADAASPDGRSLAGVGIFRRDARGLLTERVAAAAARAGSGGWSLRDVTIDRVGSGRIDREHRAVLAWSTALQPPDVAAFFAASPSLSAAAARRALTEAAPVSRGESLFATRLHRSAAEPLAPLVMLLLALPLAFVAPRTGRSWPATLYAAAGGLAYLVADGVLTVMAQVGYLPAAVGAWAAPAVAVPAALAVLLYSER